MKKVKILRELKKLKANVLAKTNTVGVLSKFRGIYIHSEHSLYKDYTYSKKIIPTLKRVFKYYFLDSTPTYHVNLRRNPSAYQKDVELRVSIFLMQIHAVRSVHSGKGLVRNGWIMLNTNPIWLDMPIRAKSWVTFMPYVCKDIFINMYLILRSTYLLTNASTEYAIFVRALLFYIVKTPTVENVSFAYPFAHVVQ
jgi:hypothetical protein